MVVPVNTSKNFTATSADHHLRKAVCATVHPLFTAGACLHIPAAYQFFLHLHVDFLGDNGLMVIFYIILRCDAVIGHTGLVQDIDGAGLLEQCIPMYFSLVRIFLTVLVYHFLFPAPVRMPSASSPWQIISMLAPSRYFR